MPIDFERELNKEQLDVVLHGDGPCLVLAGAGTGKTRTIVYRIAYLLEHGVPPQEILLLTFTNRAAKEMMSRISGLFPQAPQGLWGGTFHHVGNLFLRMYGPRIGISSSFTIMDEEDSEKLVQSILERVGLNKEEKRVFPKAGMLRGMISFCRNSGIDMAEMVRDRYPQYESRVGEIARIAELYEEQKRAARVVDFDDLLSLWLQLLEAEPSLSRQFKYILVDEYQDTNRLQGKIISTLARHHNNIFVVGDDAQSIYSFRAATVENILEFPKLFANAKVFRLEENYRSHQEILDLANVSLAYNVNQFGKTLMARRGKGEKPELAGFETSREEASWVADHIMDALEDDVALNEMVVLFRASFQALHVELELQKRGIQYIMRGGMRFFERAHVKDVIAHLKLIANHHDKLAWLRLLKMEQGIGEKTALNFAERMAEVAEISGFLPLLESKTISGSKSAYQGCRLLVNRLMELHDLETTAAMIEHVLEGSYRDYASLVFEDAPERMEDLEQLVTFARTYQDLTSFLSDVTLSEGFRGERIGAREDTKKDYLVLSTIHQAKGLEWERVFLIGLTQGQFPHYKSWRSSAELEEERRLFYVAVTRAKNKLSLTFPLLSMASGGEGASRPSVFISEVSPALFRNAWEERTIDVDT